MAHRGKGLKTPWKATPPTVVGPVGGKTVIQSANGQGTRGHIVNEIPSSDKKRGLELGQVQRKKAKRAGGWSSQGCTNSGRSSGGLSSGGKESLYRLRKGHIVC